MIIESVQDPSRMRYTFHIIEAKDRELFSMEFVLGLVQKPEMQAHRFGHQAGWVELHFRQADGREVAYRLTGTENQHNLGAMVMVGELIADTEWKKQ